MLAAGGELDEHLLEDELLAAALGAGLTEREARASIRSGLFAGLTKPTGGLTSGAERQR